MSKGIKLEIWRQGDIKRGGGDLKRFRTIDGFHINLGFQSAGKPFQMKNSVSGILLYSFVYMYLKEIKLKCLKKRHYIIHKDGQCYSSEYVCMYVKCLARKGFSRSLQQAKIPNWQTNNVDESIEVIKIDYRNHKMRSKYSLLHRILSTICLLILYMNHWTYSYRKKNTKEIDYMYVYARTNPSSSNVHVQ